MSIFLALLPAILTSLVALCVYLPLVVRHELATKERVEFWKDLFTNAAWGSQGLGAYLGVVEQDTFGSFLFSFLLFVSFLELARKLVARLEQFQ